MGTIHGKSVGTLRHLREPSSALAVYWVYVARSNNEGVAFPSLRGLAKDLGWSFPLCQAAREFLVSVKALERVDGYIRPAWRGLPAGQQRHNLALDRAEYFRVTGYAVIQGQKMPLLYSGGDEPSALEGAMINSVDHQQNAASSRETEGSTMINSVDHQGNLSELDPIPKLDTNSFLEKERKTGKKKLSAEKAQALLTAYAAASKNVKKPFNGAADARALDALGITPEDVRGCTEYLLGKDFGKQNGVSWGEVCKIVVLWKQEKASQRGADYYLGQYADFIRR